MPNPDQAQPGNISKAAVVVEGSVHVSAPVLVPLPIPVPAPVPVPAVKRPAGSTPPMIERVFPIRVEALRRQLETSGREISTIQSTLQDLDEYQAIARPAEGSRLTTPIDLDAPRVSTAPPAEERSVLGTRHVTTRFGYLPSPGDDSTQKPSSAQKIYRCEDEPIHIPGAVQRYGTLLALKEDGDGHFLVRVVSENSQSVTGHTPEELFELRCFTDILDGKDRDDFVIRVRLLYENELDKDPDVFLVSLISLLGVPTSLLCAMHIQKQSALIICEFETKQDTFSPIHPPVDGFPVEPIRITEHEATAAERLLSTTSKSKPLHAVNVARKLSHPLGAMDLFHALCEIQAQLSSAESLETLLDIIVGLVYEITGFHRVMVYQFDETAAGSVMSEMVDTRASTDFYRGLHFPASDIPKQARELYLMNTIRILYDREQETARLVCRSLEDAQNPLDLKHSYLRAMSPIHLKYLANMGVRSSMSISLVVGGKLWGLVSCHGYGAGMRVTLPVKELCRGLGNMAGSNIEKLLYLSRIQARKPLSKVAPRLSPSAYIAASSSGLLNMFGADFGFLVIKGEARTIGQVVAYSESIAILQYVRWRSFTSIFSSHAIERDLEDITHTPGFSVISGVLVVPLTLSGNDFLVFLRRGRLKEVTWAGNPHEKDSRPGNAYLEPRSSFKRWSENVLGTSREWAEDQVDSAVVLSTLYGRFIEVWRQREAIVQKNRMTRLLIRNAGHEVRTPLNIIINYLEIALEEPLEDHVRNHLENSLQASKSLVFVVNDLLNLTEAENAEFKVSEEDVNLRLVVSDVVSAFTHESAKRNVDVLLEDDQDVLKIVRSDPTKLRQVVSNLLGNAIKHSNGGKIRIGLNILSSFEQNSVVEMSFDDEGSGLSEVHLDSIFQDFEQILDDEDEDYGDAEKQASRLQESVEKRLKRPLQIGLGLAIVARFVRLNYGQISISSAGEGHGTRVSLKIPIRTVSEDGFPNTTKLTRKIMPALRRNTLIPNTYQEPASPLVPDPGGISLDDILTQSSASSDLPSTPRHTISTPSASSNGGHNIYASLRQDLQRNQRKLKVLVAEDNPLNSKLLQTHLTRKGHYVWVAADGQACLDAFKDDPGAFDIILMDLQMPIVDGVQSTRLIRALEKGSKLEDTQLAANYGRITIIAVSASLVEKHRTEYISVGFDGWISKPVDFNRLAAILAAIDDEATRRVLLYKEGSWEKGGWFSEDSFHQRSYNVRSVAASGGEMSISSGVGSE